ncbi:immunity 52 family protein [Hyalangium rubrum]|uniref:Immunity 52 family protein n=1 Tax=Hyalangium rubrum TaxID=3103134 RepID=A0ABU5HEY1_9BACT|nr:immunity 52 family protein [Hyalangium sp. s54d21]MDY7231434.1 immunity 52 family protein [Hyalangium sp. s54d21]
MIETYYAGAYWLARHESAEACARRAEALFERLGRIEPTWRHWYETGSSFAEARERPFTPDTASFKALFERKQNRMGDGFSFWLWTGDSPEETTSVDGFCGSASFVPPPVCVFKPPSEGPLAHRVLTSAVLSEVVRAMALAWEPEWCVATSEQHRDMLANHGEVPDVFVGWVMYFSRQRGPVPPLPASVRVEPVEDKGTLILLTPERFTASNPEHVALAVRVQELLDAAGLLRPLQPG